MDEYLAFSKESVTDILTKNDRFRCFYKTDIKFKVFFLRTV